MTININTTVRSFSEVFLDTSGVRATDMRRLFGAMKWTVKSCGER